MTQKFDDEHSRGGQDRLGTLWTQWLIRVSKGIQPIAYNFVIFAAYILADYVLLLLIGLVFSDIIRDLPFFKYLYDGIKISSVIVITFQVLGDYLIQLRKNIKTSLSELFRRSSRKGKQKRGGN